MQEEIIALQNSRFEALAAGKQAIQHALQLLQNAVDNWKATYLVQANIAGNCIYTDYLSDFDFIQTGEKIATILPKQQQSFLGLVQVPPQGLAKVQVGQAVHVRLDNFPYTEFGILKGKVAAIAPISSNDQHRIQVAFPKGLQSSYNIAFGFTQMMSGQAEVVTSQSTLLERLHQQIKSARVNR